MARLEEHRTPGRRVQVRPSRKSVMHTNGGRWTLNIGHGHKVQNDTSGVASVGVLHLPALIIKYGV